MPEPRAGGNGGKVKAVSLRSFPEARLTVQVYKVSSGKYMVDVLIPQAA